MITLRRVTQLEYDSYYKEAVERYTEELVQAHDLTLDEARKAASKSFMRLLPDQTPDEHDQHILVLVEGAQKVGILWFGIDKDRQPPEVYIWDLFIDTPYRGRGYGKQALLALEDHARERRISRISLNVFEHNKIAGHLYEGTGYGRVASLLAKKI